MCTVSMVMDHKWDEWNKKYQPPPPWTGPYYIPTAPMPTQEEIDEFRRLLERAREYDKRHGEPDCELQEKRDRLKKLADELGVKIDFV